MPLRPLALLAALALLVGCGDDTPDTTLESAAPTVVDPATVPDAPPASGPAASVPEAAPPMPGSPGPYTLRYTVGEDEAAQTTQIPGNLPAPVPADLVQYTALDGVPTYHIRADPRTLPEGFELNGTHFLFMQVSETGRVVVRLLRGHVGLSNNFQDLYRGRVAAFTFAPLWPEGGPRPTLTLDGMSGNAGQTFASIPLAVAPGGRPAWVQPVALPAARADDPIELKADLTLAEDAGLTPVLLYRDDRDGWRASAFTVDSRAQRAQQRDTPGATTTPYRASTTRLRADRPEAYLVLVPS